MTSERYLINAAAFCLFEENNRVLLLKRAGTNYQNGNFGLPSGHLEKGELPSDCAIRESAEEVGLVVESLDPIGVVFNTTSGDPYINFFFKANEWSGEVINREPDRCSELKWCSWGKLPENLTPEVKIALDNYQKRVHYSQI